MFLVILEHGSVTHGLRAKYGLLPMFVNKVLWEYSHTLVYISSIVSFVLQWQS